MPWAFALFWSMIASAWTSSRRVPRGAAISSNTRGPMTGAGLTTMSVGTSSVRVMGSW